MKKHQGQSKNINRDRWIESGLEFEYQVAQIFKKKSYQIIGKYTFEQFREIAELSPSRNEFVSRSCDLKVYKDFEIDNGREHITNRFELYIECKHDHQYHFLFLPTFENIEEHSKIFILTPTPYLMKYDYKAAKYIPLNCPTLSNGVSTGDNNGHNSIDKAIDQVCLSCIDSFAYKITNLGYLSGQSQEAWQEYIQIIPIIVTKATICVRDFEKPLDDKQDTIDYKLYFKEIPWGVILFQRPEYMDRFFLRSIEKYGKKYSLVPTTMESFNNLLDVDTYEAPTRCFIVNYNSLSDFLNMFETDLKGLCKDDFLKMLYDNTQLINRS